MAGPVGAGASAGAAGGRSGLDHALDLDDLFDLHDLLDLDRDLNALFDFDLDRDDSLDRRGLVGIAAGQRRNRDNKANDQQCQRCADGSTHECHSAVGACDRVPIVRSMDSPSRIAVTNLPVARHARWPRWWRHSGRGSLLPPLGSVRVVGRQPQEGAGIEQQIHAGLESPWNASIRCWGSGSKKLAGIDFPRSMPTGRGFRAGLDADGAGRRGRCGGRLSSLRRGESRFDMDFF